MALITCEHVSMSYENNMVVTDLNFKVEMGDYICIVGENGAGKSTLIKGILGLKSPAKGRIVTGDELLQKEIGYLPQQTSIQKDFPASVWEVVQSGCLNSRGMRPFYSEKEKKITQANMEKLGIENLKNRCYRELSGGQQQRVLLARALCATKKMLLLDEPVSGLDPIATAEMYAIISNLNKELGITIIMVSHDINAAISNCKQILHIQNEMLYFGTTEEYLKSNVGRAFIGKDKTEEC